MKHSKLVIGIFQLQIFCISWSISYTTLAPCSSRRSREVYLLILFIYEKIHLRTSILEASLILYSILYYQEASCEAETLDQQRKIPTSNGDFSKEIFPIFTLEDVPIVS